MRAKHFALIVWFMQILLSGCTFRSTMPDTGTVSKEIGLSEITETSLPVYLLRFNDHLSLSVQGYPEFSRELIVRPDGMVTIPQIGDLPAAGYPLDSLRSQVVGKLDSILILPVVVDLAVTQISEYPVYIFGEVKRPGVYFSRQQRNIFQLLSEAGGPTGEAELEEVFIMRQRADGKIDPLRLNLKEILETDLPVSNIYVQPYDVVIVPETFVAELGDLVESYFVKIVPPVDVFIRSRYYWQLTDRYGR